MIFRHILALSLGAAALAAAAQQWQRPDRTPIDVQIVNGQIVVEETVAVTGENEGGIVWRLVTAGHVFPDKGIDIDSGGKHRCAAGPAGRTFRCAKLRHDKGERYKYVVNVNQRSGQALPPLDPWIQNN
jgi:hypothetical protein